MSHAVSIPVPKDDDCELPKYFDYVEKQGDKLYFSAWFDGKIYKYDRKTPKNVIPLKFHISEPDYDEYMRDALSERSTLDLPFRNYVLFDSYIGGDPAKFFSKTLPLEKEVVKNQQEAYAKVNTNMDGTAGKSIWDICKERLLG